MTTSSTLDYQQFLSRKRFAAEPVGLVEIRGDQLLVRFASHSREEYQLFLRAKRLPEHITSRGVVTAPARYAAMLDEPIPGILSPGDIVGGENDCGRVKASGIYIYALIDPFTNQLRYVGKSERPKERLTNHCNEQSKCHRTNWIRSVLSRGKRPLLFILQRLPKGGDWQAAERDWITYGRSAGWPLVNGTDGGDGVTGLSAEIRQKMAETWTGRKHKPESLLKIGEASRGRKHSQEYKEMMQLKMSQRHFSKQHRQRLSKASRKLSDEQAASIRARINQGESFSTLAVEFHVHRDTIKSVYFRTGGYSGGQT